MTTATPATRSLAEGGEWLHFGADPRFEYPIDYAIRILGWSPDTQTVDFLGRWAPHAYCHFHRHLGATTSLVLEGEHHTVETVAGRQVPGLRMTVMMFCHEPDDVETQTEVGLGVIPITPGDQRVE